MISKFKYFVPLLIAVTGICGTIYLAVQQDLRIGANDPQIQMAEDLKTLPSGDNIEISKSLAPFIAFYDSSGKLIKSNATLDGKDIAIPSGIFDYTKTSGEDRVTWQPRSSVRIALVVVKTDQGFTASGRSLREVEKRIGSLGQEVFLGWVVTVGLDFLILTLLN